MESSCTIQLLLQLILENIFGSANEMYIGDDEADLFFFIGEPKEILDEYTNLTGKAAMPPLWSFGFWMSRITYFSEKEGRQVRQRFTRL